MPENNENQAKTHFDLQYEAIVARASECATILSELVAKIDSFSKMDLATAKETNPTEIIMALSGRNGLQELKTALMAYERDWHMQSFAPEK